MILVETHTMSPTRSRSAKRVPNTPPVGTARQGTIACAEGFDFAASTGFLRGFSPMNGDQRVTDLAITKALVHREQTIVFQVYREGGLDARTLRYQLSSDAPISDASQAFAADHIASFLSAGEDMAPFRRRAAEDPAFAPVARRLAGLHHVKFPTPFEAACWGTINQRLQRRQARAMKEALCRELGGVSGDLLAFPEAATLVRAGEAEIARILGNARKAKVIAAVSAAFADVDDAFLRTAPLSTIETWLHAIHGVGPFTSAFVLFRGLGRFTRQPLAEGLLDAAATVYGRRLTPSDMQRLSASYGAWGGHWALYLWASSMEFARDRV